MDIDSNFMNVVTTVDKTIVKSNIFHVSWMINDREVRKKLYLLL